MADKKKDVSKQKPRGVLELTYKTTCGLCGCFGQRLVGFNTIGALLDELEKNREYSEKHGWVCKFCAKEEAKRVTRAEMSKIAQTGWPLERK